jgi:type IV pilus assembly protein PilO
MNFTAKDKKILTFVGVFLVLFFSWKFFFNPQLKSISTLKREINEKKDTYSYNLIYKEKSQNLESELKFLNQRLQDLKANYPPDLNYDEIFIIIKKVASSSGVNISNVKFDEKSAIFDGNKVAEETPLSTEPASLNQSVSQTPDVEGNTMDADGKKIQEFINGLGLDLAANSNVKSPVKNGEGYKIGLKLMGIGKINQIEGFLKSIEDLKNKTLYSQLQINKIKDDELNFSLDLSFVGISSSKAGEKVLDAKDMPVAQKDIRQDIFNPYDGYVENNITKNRNTFENTTNITLDEIKKYDFTMRVMPYGDNIAPPTVSLTAKKAVLTGTTANIPVVYGDSSKEVNIELYVEELKGKYYFKFKTNQEAFPDPQYTNTHQFIPEGDDITLLVDSTPRKFLSDKSTAVLKIINKTGVNVKVNVINEDKNNPRVKFENIRPNTIISYR